MRRQSQRNALVWLSLSAAASLARASFAGPDATPSPASPSAAHPVPVNPAPVSPAPVNPALATRPAAPLSPPAARVLTLKQAVDAALEHQPQMQQAKASLDAANARTDEAFSPLLPQITGNASYQRTTSNFAPRPGALPSSVSSAQNPTFTTSNYFNFGVSANQLVYDFGQTTGRWHMAQANADVQQKSSDTTRMQVVLAVKNAFFQARARKALIAVAQETLDNQKKHLAQIEGFVEVGTRPRIDVVQALSDRQSAELSLLTAENAYDVAKAQLAQSMGLEAAADFDIADELVAPIEGEDSTTAELFQRALADRPDVKGALNSIRAQEIAIRAAQGGYGPTVGVSTSLTEAGTQIDDLRWNWNAGASLTWPIFQGGLTRAQVVEARANLAGAQAQVAMIRQQVLVDVEQARLGVRGAKKTLLVAEQLIESTRERFNLAEGRYQTGAGSIIELDDAQVALTTARGQKVQAEYDLCTARAGLAKALGKP